MEPNKAKKNGLGVFTAVVVALAMTVTACGLKSGAAGDGEAASPQAHGSRLKTISEKEFEPEVAKAEQVVVVKFYADWCPPCKLLTPIMEELAGDYTSVKFVAVDTDASQELAAKYQIEALPTVLFFKNGKIVDKIVGLEKKDALSKRIQAVVGRS